LRDLKAQGYAALVFSQFVRHLELVRAALEAEGFSLAWLDGSTPVARRAREVERFQEGGVDVFLISLKAGGVGLNLTAADTVFILDPWWNTSAETQAIDRTHRIGQKKSVFTYRLIAENSIEEKILELQKRKKELVDMVVSSDGAALKTLTEEDINHLLGE
jgi:SNF2 family DNA or RNA helicase